MTNIPDINLMREVAEEKTSVFIKEFEESEIFKKMCSDIQNEANKGNFSKLFDASSYGGHKSLTAAQELFIKHGYNTRIFALTLVVSWGRTNTFEKENE